MHSAVKKRTTFDSSLFDAWSRELAYLVGATITDGCVISADYEYYGRIFRNRHVSWQVVDLDWLETLKRITSATRSLRVCREC